jgi:hypothetical protein
MVTLLSFFILSFSITPNLFTTSDDCDTERLLQVITKILIVMTIVTVNALLSIHVGTVCFPIQLQVQTTNFRSKIVSKVNLKLIITNFKVVLLSMTPFGNAKIV